MVAVVILLALLLGSVLMLAALGWTAGDREGDALVTKLVPQDVPRGATVVISNPGELAVIVGISLRRRSLRLLLEGDSYVRNRAARSRADLMPASQTVVGVVGPGEAGSFSVPAQSPEAARAQLVAVIGQPGRLRTVHRAVRLP